MLQKTLFDIPIWIKEVDNFDHKKGKLDEELSKFPEVRNDTNTFLSNRGTQRDGLSEFFGNINRANHPYSLRKNLNESLLLSTTQVGLRDLLRYADKNSMANSLEVRLPFLSHELVEFIFKLPSEFKIFEGWTKFIIRKSFEKKLPNQIIWRKDKVGYMPPIRRWLNSKNVKEMIISSQKNLIKEKIISKPLMGQEWTYLMADRLIRSKLDHV